MKASDILALSKAGYTSAQIALIAQGMDEEAKEQPEQKPEQKPAEQKPEEKPAEQKPEEQKPAEQQKPDSGYAGIMAELQKLNQNIYQANIRNSNMPEQPTPDDIIAEIIRPTKKEVH